MKIVIPNKEHYTTGTVCKDDILHTFRKADNFEEVKKRVEVMENHEMEYLAKKLGDLRDFMCESCLEDVFRDYFLNEED